MKTPIQELFSQLEIEHPNLFNTNTLEGRKFINDYYKFFELEKQEIENAFYKGIQAQQENEFDKYNIRKTPEEFYNEKYKN
jgi:hypothetical protein